MKTYVRERLNLILKTSYLPLINFKRINHYIIMQLKQHITMEFNKKLILKVSQINHRFNKMRIIKS